jgi:ABC-type nitrate/sulfonate/bicarbonate transport system substrate-binding protein
MRHACLASFGPLLVAAAVGFAGPASAADKITVGKGGQNAFVFSMIDVGVRAGTFAKHGLDVKTAEFNGGSRMQQALAAGSIEIGAGGGTDLAAISKGSPVKGIAVLGGPPLDFSITVKGNGPIKTVADLKGKKIGVTTATSLTAWLTGEFSRLQGWGSDGITRVATGSAATSWALLRTGGIDGFTGDIGNALAISATRCSSSSRVTARCWCGSAKA